MGVLLIFVKITAQSKTRGVNRTIYDEVFASLATALSEGSFPRLKIASLKKKILKQCKLE